MKNIKQHLADENKNNIADKEKEIGESDEELTILRARLKVEKKSLDMKDIRESLKEDFIYSAQALESMLAMEGNRNSELKRGLEILKYRKAVIESQFSDEELN